MSTYTVVAGDAREVAIPRCDVVITDPVWPNCPPGMLPGADGEQCELLRAVLARIEMRTLVVVLGFDSDPRFLRAVPADMPYIRSQSLPYSFPGYRGRLLVGDEMAYVFGAIPSGRGVIPGRVPAETTPRTSRACAHPAPRSLRHMLALVRWWSNSNDLVCDPFCGSGTVGMAAVMLGRSFFGIEVSPEYAALARERIADASGQRLLFA